MSKIILTVGASNSGKTTWAEQFITEKPLRINLNRDDLRKEYTATDRLQDYKYTKRKEREITTAIEEIAVAHIEDNFEVVISDTNLNPKTRQKWKDLAEELGVGYEEKHFVEPLKTLLERNLKRDYTVPQGVIFDQFMKMQEYLGEYVYKPVKGLPECIIVDIDGTLAHMEGVRGAFEWDKVHKDKPDSQLIAYLRDNLSIKAHLTKVILFSGRDECCRTLTEQWLITNGVPYDALYMRPTGTNTCDTIVKKTMFDLYVKDRYNVSHVIDDRPRVVNMWLGMGLKVWAMGNQLKDF